MMPIRLSIGFVATCGLALALSACGDNAASDNSTVTGTATLAFSAASSSVAQSAGSVSLSVTRSGSTTEAVSVSYATADGTATGGTDYTSTSGTLNWAANDSSTQSITVPVSNATPFTGTRNFTVSLSDPGTGAALGTPATATVSIEGDGSSTTSPGSVELSASSYAITQGNGSLTITVNRTGGSNGAASVQYATVNGTATAGTDYTASSGKLNWASGDESSKSFTVAISNATPFSGTKSFTVALSAASGATLGSPSNDTVTITGSGTVASNGGTDPSAPSSLVMTAQSQNSISLSWSVAAPGAAPIARYKIYRNGAEYASATGTTYTDTAATNANSPVSNSQPTLAIPNTIYAYAVAAVDTAGNEGPQQANATFWVYYNGVFNWGGDFSYPSGGITNNYSSTAGTPEDGAYDISVTDIIGAGFLPYAGKTVTTWDMEGGSFNYISLDLQPTMAGQDWEIFMFSRLPPGDVAPWANQTLVAGGYGPTPTVGKWATYKIPLSALAIGVTQMTASISGTNLVVTSIDSGVPMSSGGYVLGPNVPTGTYITSNGPGNGGVGTYTIAGPGISASTQVASTSMTEQHTGIYKFSLVDRNAAGSGNNVYYIDNIKFTVD